MGQTWSTHCGCSKFCLQSGAVFWPFKVGPANRPSVRAPQTITQAVGSLKFAHVYRLPEGIVKVSGRKIAHRVALHQKYRCNMQRLSFMVYSHCLCFCFCFALLLLLLLTCFCFALLWPGRCVKQQQQRQQQQRLYQHGVRSLGFMVYSQYSQRLVYSQDFLRLGTV